MKNLTIETFHRWTFKHQGYEITKIAPTIEQAKLDAEAELKSLKEHIKKIKVLRDRHASNKA